MEFRRLITEIAPDMKGFMQLEKDVEEFLSLIFGAISVISRRNSIHTVGTYILIPV
ncbi:hypothetical protein T03_15102 [Trichinella britovi]|uniref:Uncharacterized protein n=1 Tax=Trichinella britovi TaxID=45882 RepID=A0A0V1CWZ6_TRIBR|nr:hypothetical protein T03_15102 [Trichinella britovi]